MLTLPSFHLKCLSTATLWFHNHSNSHEPFHYFITFPVSLVPCKPGLSHQLSELELVDWYENQHVILQ